MKKRVILLIYIPLLFMNTLYFASDIQLAKASGTIYIRADGSIEGTTHISTVDNVTYYFTNNINDSIIVERDDIVVDGAGYTLQGTENGIGIELPYRSNVTITDIVIKGFGNGIWLNMSSSNIISGNNIANNGDGILLYESSNNKFYHNDFINNTQQVYDYSWDHPWHYNSINSWDDGYPSEGNYWSDYEERYSNAREIDGSGIRDTPYVIDESNQDNYPLIPEFPSFLILPLFIIATLLAVIIYKENILCNIRYSLEANNQEPVRYI